jgi:hypothetical protein
MQPAHQFAPGLRADVPCHSVVLRADERHDAIADEGHGSEVLPAFRQEHRYASVGLEGLLTWDVAGRIDKAQQKRAPSEA